MRPQARTPKELRFALLNYLIENRKEDEEEVLEVELEEEDDDDEDSDDQDEENVRQQNLRELKRRKIEEETRLIEEDPENPDHFERLLSSNPNRSFIWIKYMSLCLEAKEVEKSREIGKRALCSIYPSEETERLNIWDKLLSIEEYHGTSESFKQTMKEAFRSFDDEYKIYLMVLRKCANSTRIRGVDSMVSKITRKFSGSIDAYLQCATVHFKLKETNKARSILQKALSILPTKSHVTMISAFALLENEDGSPEEAQTLFEHVLTCFPSRIDMWKLYVDMLTKSNRIDLARHAFKRAASQQGAPVGKMLRLFYKWKKFEEKYGTSESLVMVQECLDNFMLI